MILPRVKLLRVVVASLLVPVLLPAQFWDEAAPARDWHGQVWAAPVSDFSAADYSEAVERLFTAFEAATGKALEPGRWGRAALKLDTHSGPGLSTPQALTRAVIDALVRRGFERSRLLLIDSRTALLRASGYLPALSAASKAADFAGVPVLALDTEGAFRRSWFYESPVPREFTSALSTVLLRAHDPDPLQDRKSYLPYPLLHEVDFWINLPIVTDQVALGLDGVLANATLWNVSNRERFFVSSVNGPVAVAEIAAIPELRRNWAFSLVTLQQYQFIGGPTFNARYTRSLPQLWLSVDPVALDALMLHRINRARQEEGFRELPFPLPLLEYGMTLDLGTAFPAEPAQVQAPSGTSAARFSAETR